MLGATRPASPLWAARSASSSSAAGVVLRPGLTLSPAVSTDQPMAAAPHSLRRAEQMVEAANDIAKLRQSTEQLEQAMGSPLTELRVLLDMPFMRGEPVASPLLQTATEKAQADNAMDTNGGVGHAFSEPSSLQSASVTQQYPELWEFLERHALQQYHSCIVHDLGATCLDDLQGVECSDLDDMGFKKLEKLRFEKAKKSILEYTTAVSNLTDENDSPEGVVDDDFAAMERSLFAAQAERKQAASLLEGTDTVAGQMSPQISQSMENAAAAVARADQRSAQLRADMDALNLEIQSIKSRAHDNNSAALSLSASSEIMAKVSNDATAYSVSGTHNSMVATAPEHVDRVVGYTADETVKAAAQHVHDVLIRMEHALLGTEPTVSSDVAAAATTALHLCAELEVALTTTARGLDAIHGEIGRWIELGSKMQTAVDTKNVSALNKANNTSADGAAAVAALAAGTADELRSLISQEHADAKAVAHELDRWIALPATLCRNSSSTGHTSSDAAAVTVQADAVADALRTAELVVASAAGLGDVSSTRNDFTESASSLALVQVSAALAQVEELAHANVVLRTAAAHAQQQTAAAKATADQLLTVAQVEQLAREK
eukprot:SAG31_NODE_647_length_13211_cov_10.529362_2_plen_606_part_00